MPAFVAKLLQLIGPVFFNWLYEKGSQLVEAYKARQEIKKKAKEEAEAVRKKTEAAQTEKEREEALRSDLRNS